MNLNIQMNENDFCYKTFFKHSFRPMIITDLVTLNIVDVNLAACAFYKYEYEEMIKLKVTDINNLTVDQFRIDISELENINIGHFTLKNKLSNGELIDVLLERGIIYLNKKKYLLSINYIDYSKDVVVAEFSRLSKLMQLMIDNLPFISWFKDIHGRYKAVNRPFEEYCGLTREDIIDKNDYEIFPKDEADIYINGDKKVIAIRERGHFEEINDKGVWKEEYKEYKSPVFDKKGNIIGTIGITHDITNRKLEAKALHDAEQREKELLEEAIKIKDSFITLITHEFKTPLTIINAAIQTMDLVCKDEITDRTKKYLIKINQNSLRLQKLVDNLLDLTKLQAGYINIKENNVEIISYTKELIESVNLFANQKDINIIFKSKFKSLNIIIDEEKFERILLNLLSNAIKFSQSNKNTYVTLMLQKDFIKVSVRDYGVGIALEKQGVIFEKFEQADSSLSRQAEGTGIGLYLVKLLIDSLGGTITLKSKVGWGSKFEFLIPIKIDEQNISCNKNHINRMKRSIKLELSDMHFESIIF